MANFTKNFLLFVVILVLSYLAAEYFGALYDKFSPLYDRSLIGFSKEDLISLTGVPFAYIFFTVLLFKLFGSGNTDKWVGWLLVLPFLFFASGDLKHIHLPIILALITFGLAALLRKIFKINQLTSYTRI
ncbi:MAG: hypothetical protein HYX23_01725 [Candidatus Zambryskibacteria bacterium]|nr:hypothetical protein [Candidatus Zambryskibacteria bacterium]